ncbi:peptidoglycan DD-metalloendopeptidase family protein [Jannaschia sp. R86511]|uniref:peptidoglycan DD-metalloendopeptidase family protein n=1 Tax=Jannaschia sp. R86511 TaxID=3093853 RepID=UPI0036D3739F
MAAAVTGWVTAAVLVLGGTAVVAAAATPGPVPDPPAPATVAQGPPPPGRASGAARTTSAGERVPPLPGPVVRPFVPPPHDYGPGHRGVDLPAAAGATVVSPTDGVVTFAGPVAGRGVVVVEHPGGTLTSLEPVTAAGGVGVGVTVSAGEPVAVVRGTPRHAGCPPGPGACLHWGVRVQGRYVDPWWWLGRGGAVRLLPAGPDP